MSVRRGEGEGRAGDCASLRFARLWRKKGKGEREKGRRSKEKIKEGRKGCICGGEEEEEK